MKVNHIQPSDIPQTGNTFLLEQFHMLPSLSLFSSLFFHKGIDVVNDREHSLLKNKARLTPNE
jgi:hypothetical protein